MHILRPLPKDHALALTTHLLNGAGKLPDAGDWEAFVMSEHFGSFAQGKPLGMRLPLAASCVSAKGLSIAGFLELLFNGSSVPFNLSSSDLMAYRAVRGVQRLLSRDYGGLSA